MLHFLLMLPSGSMCSPYKKAHELEYKLGAQHIPRWASSFFYQRKLQVKKNSVEEEMTPKTSI